jgi:hypothetical protein
MECSARPGCLCATVITALVTGAGTALAEAASYLRGCPMAMRLLDRRQHVGTLGAASARRRRVTAICVGQRHVHGRRHNLPRRQNLQRVPPGHGIPFEAYTCKGAQALVVNVRATCVAIDSSSNSGATTEARPMSLTVA